MKQIILIVCMVILSLSTYSQVDKNTRAEIVATLNVEFGDSAIVKAEGIDNEILILSGPYFRDLANVNETLQYIKWSDMQVYFEELGFKYVEFPSIGVILNEVELKDLLVTKNIIY